MARRTRSSQQLPEGSWILEGNSDSSLSDSSDEVQDTSTASQRTASRKPRLAMPSTTATMDSPYHSEEPFAMREPQFVMPSIRLDDRSQPSSLRARKRAPAAGARASASTGNLRSRMPTRLLHRSEHHDTENVGDYVHVVWVEILLPLVKFSHSTFAQVFRILKPALAFFAAIWIIFFVGHHLLTSTVARALAPLCSIPGMSHLDLPFCSVKPLSGPVEFDQLMTVQSAFEDVLSSSSGGITLPADMKRSESSIRDLKHLVQYSSLNSRGELVFEFTGFIETAREASSDLTRFNSRLGRAVDHVISTNRWTLQVIDGVAEREASTGAVGRFIYGTILFPFSNVKVTEQLLLEQYLQHTRAVEEHIAELILEAQALLAILQNLDDRLDVIHGITTRDGVSIKGSREELFAQLWTKLGGNWSSRKKHDDQLYLLQQVSNFRKVAWDHVSTTMLKLQSIAAGLEDLRDRVAAPDVLGPREDIPLKLHIDNIQMAVDRLDGQRTESRKLEGEHYRKALGKGSEQLLLP